MFKLVINLAKSYVLGIAGASAAVVGTGAVLLLRKKKQAANTQADKKSETQE